MHLCFRHVRETVRAARCLRLRTRRSNAPRHLERAWHCVDQQVEFIYEIQYTCIEALNMNLKRESLSPLPTNTWLHLAQQTRFHGGPGEEKFCVTAGRRAETLENSEVCAADPVSSIDECGPLYCLCKFWR